MSRSSDTLTLQIEDAIPELKSADGSWAAECLLWKRRQTETDDARTAGELPINAIPLERNTSRRNQRNRSSKQLTLSASQSTKGDHPNLEDLTPRSISPGGAEDPELEQEESTSGITRWRQQNTSLKDKLGEKEAKVTGLEQEESTPGITHWREQNTSLKDKLGEKEAKVTGLEQEESTPGITHWREQNASLKDKLGEKEAKVTGLEQEESTSGIKRWRKQNASLKDRLRDKDTTVIDLQDEVSSKSWGECALRYSWKLCHHTVTVLRRTLHSSTTENWLSEMIKSQKWASAWKFLKDCSLIGMEVKKYSGKVKPLPSLLVVAFYTLRESWKWSTFARYIPVSPFPPFRPINSTHTTSMSMTLWIDLKTGSKGSGISWIPLICTKSPIDFSYPTAWHPRWRAPSFARRWPFVATKKVTEMLSSWLSMLKQKKCLKKTRRQQVRASVALPTSLYVLSYLPMPPLR